MEEMFEETMERPYTKEELKERADENGYVKDRVSISFKEIADIVGAEDFRNMLGAKLAGEHVENISFKAAEIKNVDAGMDAYMIIEVSGNVSKIIND